MISLLTIIIFILGLCISVYDLKSRSIPVLFLGLHFLSIIIYISIYSLSIGIILGLLGIILFYICLTYHYAIDWIYVLLICVGILLLKHAMLFTVYMLIPIIVFALVLFIAKPQKFPHMVCLTTIISLILIQIL